MSLRPLILALMLGMTASLPAAADGGGDFAAFARRAEAGESLTVVFFGASLTWGANATDPQLYSYRADVAKDFITRYPKAHFTFWDAAIGGTGSQLGVFRLDHDVLSRHPDLVFLDFTANDDITSADEETLSSYEAIVRRLVLGGIPVVQVVFPFESNMGIPALDAAHFPRRTAHEAISRAYHTAFGDALGLIQARITSHAVTMHDVWPHDGIHPGNFGYSLFAAAAWKAYQDAVTAHLVCQAPQAMIHRNTYIDSARVRFSTLGPLPAGWTVGSPDLISAYYDMLMSRWLDDEVIATIKPGHPPEPLKARFHGEMVMVFGESTEHSVSFTAVIDGDGRPGLKPVRTTFDGGSLARGCHGNVHLQTVLATGLDPSVLHTIVITPLAQPGQSGELRLESLCVAGPGAAVLPP